MSCFEFVHCTGWNWENCPKSLQGIRVAINGKPIERRELACSLFLWIWSLQFGLPGVMNDLKILEATKHFGEVLLRKFPSVYLSFAVTRD